MFHVFLFLSQQTVTLSIIVSVSVVTGSFLTFELDGGTMNEAPVIYLKLNKFEATTWPSKAVGARHFGNSSKNKLSIFKF